MKKVAILSPLFHYLRGSEYTAVVLCEALNEKKIVPDIFAYFDPKNQIEKRFNKKIQYNFKKIFPVPKKLLFFRRFFSILSFLKLKNIKNYDFVFDLLGYDYPFGYNNNGNYLLYCHFPYYLVSLQDQLKTAGVLKKMYYSIFLVFNYYVKHFEKKSNSFVVANSNFTRKKLRKVYKNQKINVIYPPVSFVHEKKFNKENVVFSLGAFDEDKNQLMQIKLAKEFPNYKFHLCGQISDKNYYKKAKKKAMPLKNVYLHPNIEYKELRKIMMKAKFFLHTKSDEHFGISIVEAISLGCIPLVHNSGGQIEIVNNEKLRFNSFEELVKKFRCVTGITQKKFNIAQNDLKNHINQFHEKNFKQKMIKYLK